LEEDLKLSPNRILQLLAISGIFIVVGTILFPIVATVRPGERPYMCLAGVKQLATASMIYLSDYDDRFMHRDHWMDWIVPYHKNKSLEHCPAVVEESKDNKALYGYAFNSKLSLVKMDDIEKPAEEPLIYDSINLARNASDPFVSLPSPPRVHGRGRPGANNVAYSDGHGRALVK
jgi:hypothetical protein